MYTVFSALHFTRSQQRPKWIMNGFLECGLSDLSLLASLQDIARSVARDEIMPRFQRVAAEHKADGSLLTEADLAAQYALVQRLPQLLAYPVLGEEMTIREQEALLRASPDGLWVVDPIDGTTNFSRGLPFFAVSIALIRYGRPSLGVVYAPVLDECFAAAASEGAWLNGKALSAGVEMPLSQAVATIETKRLLPDMASRFVGGRPFHSQRNFGAATLDWCWLAAGRTDVMLYGAQKLWDFAAGALILAEAGGCVGTLEIDDFWKADVWQRSVVAARTPALFKQWRDWLHSHRPSAM